MSKSSELHEVCLRVDFKPGALFMDFFGFHFDLEAKKQFFFNEIESILTKLDAKLPPSAMTFTPEIKETSERGFYELYCLFPIAIVAPNFAQLLSEINKVELAFDETIIEKKAEKKLIYQRASYTTYFEEPQTPLRFHSEELSKLVRKERLGKK